MPNANELLEITISVISSINLGEIFLIKVNGGDILKL